MRWLTLFVVLAGCGKSSSSPKPDLAKFAAMSREEQCKATEERGARCADAQLIANLRALSVNGGSDVEPITQELAKAPPSDLAASRKMHEVQCADDRYPAAVVACWDIADCTEFATCVVRHLPSPPLRPATP
jgi:hypothetical protein